MRYYHDVVNYVIGIFIAPPSVLCPRELHGHRYLYLFPTVLTTIPATSFSFVPIPTSSLQQTFRPHPQKTVPKTLSYDYGRASISSKWIRTTYHSWNLEHMGHTAFILQQFYCISQSRVLVARYILLLLSQLYRKLRHRFLSTTADAVPIPAITAVSKLNLTNAVVPRLLL